MAILKFRIYWEEDESIYRDIAIRHTQFFKDLHFAILKSYEFDSKHEATFYRSNDNWQRGREITFEKYNKVYRVDPLLMSDVPIGNEIKNTNQKFIFEYDFNKYWQFLVELIQIDKSANPRFEYPVCVRIEGLAPAQYGTKSVAEKKNTVDEEKFGIDTEELREGFGSEGEEEAGAADEGTYSDDENQNA